MAGAYNTFETGFAPGTILTGDNSGSGGAGTAFASNFYQSAGSTVVYDSTSIHGSLAARIALIGSGGVSMGFAPVNSQTQVWTRGYFRYSSTPNANTLIHFVRDGAVGNSGFGVRVTSSGVLQMREHVNYTTLASVSLEADSWYRLELNLDVSGDWSTWLHQADSETPLLEESGTVASTAASKFDTIRWGAEGSSLSGEWLLDELAWSDEGRIGAPVSSVPSPSRFVFDGADWVPVDRIIKQ